MSILANTAWRPALLSRLYHYIGSGGHHKTRLWQEFFRQALEPVDHPFYSHLVRWQNTAWASRFLSRDLVAGVDPARLETAKQELGDHVATYPNAEEMAASGLLDAGVVILPHNLHSFGTKTLLDAGLHVVCEKPFALTAAECDEAIALAEEKGVMLSVYHNRHWDIDVLALREIVDAGTIGDVFSLECNMLGYGRPRQWWRSD